jgi:hypothetical protein
MKFRILTALILVALLAGPGVVLAQEGDGEEKPAESGEEKIPGAEDGKLPSDLKPAEKPPEKTEAEKREELRKRKDAFFKMFKNRLEEMELEQGTPEQEEIARLASLKGDYKDKLGKSQKNLDRSKQIVRKSFEGLIRSNQDPRTVESRCENIWLDYMANSRKYKMEIHEYERAIKGLDRRIAYIRHRLKTREYPTAEKGEKYYLSDPIEVYTEDPEIAEPELGSRKSQVSYYALLKDFVLGILGKGRMDLPTISRRLTKPPLVEMYENWKRRVAVTRRVTENK